MGAFDPDATCTLTDDLIAFWKLDEASGTRVDSFGSNDLTDNNTVTQAAGKVGNAAQFTRANSETLSIADNTDLSTGDIDFTLGAWVYLDSKPGADDMDIISRFTPGDGEYLLRWSIAVDEFDMNVFNGAGGYLGNITSSSFGSPSTGTWYFVVAWHDAIANTINIQIDNGTVDSVASNGALGDGTTDTVIGGRDQSGGAANSEWDGRIDEVYFGKRVLTSQERTDLYNSGSGNTFDPSGTCTIASKPHFFMMFD